MKRYLPLRVESFSKDYPATLGAVMLFSTPNPTPRLSGLRTILTDKFGGKLKFGPLRGQSLAIATRHKVVNKEKFDLHANIVVQYSVRTKASANSLWWQYLDRIRALCVYSFLLEGPFILDDVSIGYLKLDGCPGMLTRQLGSWHTDPRCYPRYGLPILRVPTEYESFVRTCGDIYAALGHQLLLHPGGRWDSKDKNVHKGTRLELALVLLGQSTTHTHLYDLPLRVAIALEALFQSSQLDMQSVRLICGCILRNSHDPEVVLNWAIDLSAWRNRFVHGQEPPFYYPASAEPTKRLVKAAECGLQLLRALLTAILRNSELTEIFNTTGDDVAFARKLYVFCTRPC